MVAQQDLFHQITISDYLFAMDRIFASINLNEDELSLCNNIARVMSHLLLNRSCCISQTSTSILLKRIEAGKAL